MRRLGCAKGEWGLGSRLAAFSLLIVFALGCGVTSAHAADGTLVFSEDFTNADAWMLLNNTFNGDFVPWSIDSADYTSAPSCLSHSPYGASEDSTAKTKQEVDLTGATTATLKFKAAYNTEPGLHLIKVFVYSGQDGYDKVAEMSGSSGGAFESKTVDLSQYAGQRIRLEFRLQTTIEVDDYWVTNGIARIDDVEVWTDAGGPPGGGGGDDDIPGVIAPASPISEAVDAATDTDDVFKVYLAAGERLSVALSGAAGTTFHVYLFAPDALHVQPPDQPVAGSNQSSYPEDFEYTAPTSGYYYIDVYAYAGSGAYSLTYGGANAAGTAAVYRFLNKKSGVHFYTAAESEMNFVKDTLSSTYTYEGIAYRVAPTATAGAIPVYRFLSKKLPYVHFYTATEAEMTNVKNTMTADWGYEGVAYYVWPAASGTLTPVWRFFKPKQAVHFYTATESEMTNVKNTMTADYTYEGTAYYVEP